MKKDTNCNCLYKPALITIILSLLLVLLGFTIDKYLRNIIREESNLSFFSGCREGKIVIKGVPY